MLKCQNTSDVMHVIADRGIVFVDLKFTDPFGQWQHMTIPAHSFPVECFSSGIAFDGSSIRGWKGIEESDMLLMPDPTSAFWDPFCEDPTLSLICDIVDPLTKKRYHKDPRTIAHRALEVLRQSGIGDVAYFGPEAEFFIFDELKYSNGSNHSYYEVDSIEAAWNTGRDEEPNLGGKLPHKRGYFPAPPLDQLNDIRCEMVKELEVVDIRVEKSHHEVGTAGQGEINFNFSDIISTGDNMQKFKYVLKNVAKRHNKLCTFMPKPLANDNGSGMHTHLSIFKDGQNAFAGNGYAGLSNVALHAIGGIIKHGKTIAAFTNPTTNSYHRLVPGFEAPVCLAYSARNRSVAIRIPVGSDSALSKRLEVRFPDPSANPYLAFSAILLAAIDGIQNQLDPGSPSDEDMYALSDAALKLVPQMPGSLQEAIDSLRTDNDFLKVNDTFSQSFLDMWIESKQAEIDAIRLVPHPKEFELYYDL